MAKKKRTQRRLLAAQAHIHASFNNTIIAISDEQGNVIASSSAGACGFRGAKKGTAYAASVAVDKTLNLVKNNFGVRRLTIHVKGVGQGRDAAIRALINAGLEVNSIIDKTTVAHGGVRPRRARRV